MNIGSINLYFFCLKFCYFIIVIVIVIVLVFFNKISFFLITEIVVFMKRELSFMFNYIYLGVRCFTVRFSFFSLNFIHKFIVKVFYAFCWLRILLGLLAVLGLHGISLLNILEKYVLLYRKIVIIFYIP